jgi:hypothetical protein
VGVVGKRECDWKYWISAMAVPGNGQIGIARMIKRIILQNQLVSILAVMLILYCLYLGISNSLGYAAVYIALATCVYLALRRFRLVEDTELTPQPYLYYGILLVLGVVLVHVYVAADHISGTLVKYGVAAFLIAMSEAWWGPWLERHPGFRLFLVAVAAISMGFFLLHDKLGAKWFWATDHRIAALVGPDGLGLRELLDLIMNSETFHPFSSLRYKPIHDLYRIGGAYLFQDSYFLWHLSKFIIFVLVVFFTCLTFVRYLGGVAGIIFGLFLFSFNFWSDIYVKIHPSESLAALGVAMFVYFGLVCLNVCAREKVENPKKAYLNAYFGVASLGAIIAIGSKENFIIILPFYLLLVSYLTLRRRLNLGMVLATIIVIGFSVLEIMAILHLAGKGNDVYMQSTNPATRIQILLEPTGTIWRGIADSGSILGLPVLIAGLCIFADRETLRQGLSNIGLGLFGIISCAGVYLFNYMFYYGKLPANNRYDYPAALMLPVIFAILFIFLAKINTKAGMDEKAIHLGRSMLAAILVLVMVGQGFAWRHRVLQYKNSTLYFTNIIEKTANDVKRFDPGIPLVMEPVILQYEEVFAVRAFLKLYGLRNPVILKYTPGAEPTPYLKANRKLYETLDLQFQKATTEGRFGFLPASELEKYDKAICIVFGADKGDCDKCIYTTSIFNW